VDPNVVWQRILETVDSLVKDTQVSPKQRMYPKERKEVILDLAYDVHTLGEWFTKGGFAPNETSKASPVTLVG